MAHRMLTIVREPHTSTSGEISVTRNKGALIAFRCGAYKR